jgi:hypothetical protein
MLNIEFLKSLFPDLNNDYIELRSFNRITHQPQQEFYQIIKYNDVKELSKEHDVYFGVLPRTTKEGGKKSIKKVSCLFVDVDAKDFKGDKEEALAKIRAFPIKPTAIIDSGNGYHVYWLLKESFIIATEQDVIKIETYLKALAQALDGDLACAEVARILRVPGTLNHKNPKEPKLVIIIEFNPSQQSNISDFDPFLSIPEPNNQKGNPAGWIAETLLNMAEGNRNATFTKIIGRLLSDGWLPNDMYVLLEPHALKHSYPLGELQRQIEGMCQRYPAPNSHISLNSHHKEWVKPINEEAYYGLAGDIVKKIEPHSEADPVAILIQILTCFGNVIGNKPHFKVEGDKHALKLFSTLVGRTSKGRKGTSWSCARWMFESVDPSWNKEKIVSGLASGEGLINAVSDENNPSNDKRLLVVESEFSSTLKVMGREGSILSDIIRKAWDADYLSNLTKNNPLRATNTHISLIGHITIIDLRKNLNENEKANGFGNRFLWICVARSKLLPEGGKIHTLDFRDLVNRLREAVQKARNIGVIKRDDKAAGLWREVYPILSEGKEGIVGDLTARSEAYVMRLACIYALLDCSAIIRTEHLKAALAVWDYAEASVEYIFEDMLGNQIADDILQALKSNPDGLSRTQISELFSKHKSSADIQIALDLLLQTGKAKCQIIPTGGSSKELWMVAK